MIAHIFAVVALAAVANAGGAVSYAGGNIERRGWGGIGIGGGEEIGRRGWGEIGVRGGEEIGRRGLGGEGIGLGRIGVGLVGGGGGLGRGDIDTYAPPKYEFNYGIGDPKTGDRKEQSEVRVGDVVKGEYSLAEPDGTIRVVKYTADDKHGFNARVERIGKSLHPQVLLGKGEIGGRGI